MSAAAQVEKLLYTKDEAAYALGISPRSIDRMVAGQVLTTRRLGRRVLIPASDVKSVAAQIVRQDMLGPIGAPVTKLSLVRKHATQSQETPEEGARRLRTSAR